MAPTMQSLVQILLCLTSTCVLQLAAQSFLGQNPCISKTTCHECIQTPSCAWCSQPASEFGDHPRCFQPAGHLLHKRCKKEYEYFPSNHFAILVQKALTKGQGSGGAVAGGAASSSSSSASEIIQVSPQRVQMKLRARESYSFHIHFAQAKDYPVDLYYLMDLSKSMADDKDKLSTLGDLLAETMRNMTSEFQLGFGSFVDKVVMPYVSIIPYRLEHPCTNCSAPYGYVHSMQLSKKTKQFAHMVKAAEISGNLDEPEGGLDAIMQAVVCKNEIGWRDNARRLLVFSTDEAFHYAGDGKMGGIIPPNDGLCHLERMEGGRYKYSYSSIQDYPSISQLNVMVKQQAVNVIFAVTEKQTTVYNKLRSHIEGASLGILSADSSNVVDLVKKQYQAITSRVEMKDNATSGIEITYYTTCLNAPGTAENKTNVCENFTLGQVIDFKLEVFFKECPKDRSKWKQTIQVHPVGLTDSIYIDLEMLCSCPCEQPGDPGYKVNAPECNGSGTLQCGICNCSPLFYGRKCECPIEMLQKQNTTLSCRAPNSTVECSGRGICTCGLCDCTVRDNPEEKIIGPFCECDNFSCNRHQGQLCGGHGKCDCGRCNCEPPWTGPGCECYNATHSCFPPFTANPQMCSGHGDCICGACRCEVTEEGRYTGRYCERCPNCTEICDELEPCVLCHMYETGPYYEDGTCVEKCVNFTIVEVEVVQADEQNDEFICAGYDKDKCKHVFVYKKVNETHYIVKAQKERECRPKVFLLGVVLGVMAAVILMGLALLLLWKIMTTISDSREFAKFERERMKAKWDTGENPIYKQATSTFKNPTYTGKR